MEKDTRLDFDTAWVYAHREYVARVTYALMRLSSEDLATMAIAMVMKGMTTKSDTHAHVLAANVRTFLTDIEIVEAANRTLGLYDLINTFKVSK